MVTIEILLEDLEISRKEIHYVIYSNTVKCEVSCCAINML